MTTTLWIQMLGIAFGLAMIYATFLRFKRKELDKFEFLLWFIGWVVVIILALVPNILDPIIQTFHFDRRLDFFIIIGFFVLLGLSFYNYSTNKKNKKKIENVIRKAALEKYKEK